MISQRHRPDAAVGVELGQRVEQRRDSLALRAANERHVHMATERSGAQGQVAEAAADDEERAAHRLDWHELHDRQQSVVVEAQQIHLSRRAVRTSPRRDPKASVIAKAVFPTDKNSFAFTQSFDGFGDNLTNRWFIERR